MRAEKLCREYARCSLLVKALDRRQQITGAGAAGEIPLWDQPRPPYPWQPGAPWDSWFHGDTQGLCWGPVMGAPKGCS